MQKHVKNNKVSESKHQNSCAPLRNVQQIGKNWLKNAAIFDKLMIAECPALILWGKRIDDIRMQMIKGY